MYNLFKAHTDIPVSSRLGSVSGLHRAHGGDVGEAARLCRRIRQFIHLRLRRLQLQERDDQRGVFTLHRRG